MAVDFYELLDSIRLRPVFYISEPSITALYNFILGYSFHNELRSKILKDTNPPFPEFHSWIAMRTGFREATSGWRNMLLKVERGNEEKAFQRFFVFLDEFRQRQAKIILWTKLLPSEERKTQSIQIVKYTNDEGVFRRYVGSNSEIIEESYWGNLEDTLWITENQMGVLDWHSTEI